MCGFPVGDAAREAERRTMDTITRELEQLADVCGVLTSYEDEEERQAAYMAGAALYILKDIDSTQLLRKILSCNSPPCYESTSLQSTTPP